MAFVDFIPPLEQRPSLFASTFQTPDMVPHSLPPAAQGSTSLNPPPLYSSYPAAFCPRCQFASNFSVNGMCINCNMPIPINPPSLIPPIQQSTVIRPPGPVQPPHLHGHTYKDPAAMPMGVLGGGQSLLRMGPALQSSIPLTRQGSTPRSLMAPQNFGLNGRMPHAPRLENSEGFMMTSIMDALSDVLEDPQDLLEQSMNMTTGMQGGEKMLTVALGKDGSFFASPPSRPPQLRSHTNCPQDYSPLVSLTSKLISSAKDAAAGSPSTSLPSSRRTTPPGSTNNPSAQDVEPLPTFDEDELESCSVHQDEKLTYFCPTCATLLCQGCLVAEHAQHNCLGLREAFLRFKPNLEDLLGKSQVDKDLLECSLTETEKMNAKVSEKQKEAIGEVQKIFQAYREAVAQREQEVIDQINEITSMRISSLTKDKKTIGQALDSVQSLSEEGKRVLQEGNRCKVLVAHFKLNSKLQGCRPFTSSRSPSEDDSFVLKTNTVSVQSALKISCLFTTAPYPPLCTVMGEGLFFPRVNKLCTVILAAKDRAGQPCVEGGERLFVQLKSVNAGGATVPVDFRDNSDGTYSVNFRPHMKGEHQLVIAIRGQHIQGSPFTLFVDSGREYGRFGVLTQVFGSEGTQNGQFCRPWGICCDQHGNIVIGDRSNHRIQVFDMSGAFKHKFGSEGVRPGQFNRPAGVAVTREGHVVVADKDNHRVQVLKIDGSFLFMFGSKGGNDGQMIYPYDVAVNQFDGRIAVTDTGNHRLLIFSHDGILLGKFGYKGYLCGHFDSPRGIAFNDDGHIIVSDFNVHHILVIHPDGTTARILGCQGNGNGQFMRPQGITVDHMGNFIVADTRNNRIVIMHRSGHFVAKFGVSGSGPGQFDRPTSVAVLPDGRVAVVDFGNSRIQIF